MVFRIVYNNVVRVFFFFYKIWWTICLARGRRCYFLARYFSSRCMFTTTTCRMNNLLASKYIFWIYMFYPRKVCGLGKKSSSFSLKKKEEEHRKWHTVGVIRRHNHQFYYKVFRDSHPFPAAFVLHGALLPSYRVLIQPAPSPLFLFSLLCAIYF